MRRKGEDHGGGRRGRRGKGDPKSPRGKADGGCGAGGSRGAGEPALGGGAQRG